MFKNYFLVALRSYKKDKINTLISLSGLITGLTCVMLIVAYIRYETSFDTSYSNANRIYRIVSNWGFSFDGRKSGEVPGALAPALVRELPEVESETQISNGLLNVQHGNEIIGINNAEVNDNFFSIFNFKLLHGNAGNVLNDKNKIVLTASTALKLFNTTNIVGKILVVNDTTRYIVSGVAEDIPQNSFFSAESFTMSKRPVKALDELKAFSAFPSFIMLSKNASQNVVEDKLKQLCSRYKITDFQFQLQPVQDIHLNSASINNDSAGFNIYDIKYVYIYGCIALLILFIGCINFINLTIARSLERTKEVGVRKVLGAQKKQLVLQFIGETALYFIIAIPIAFTLAILCWNGFIHLLNINAGVSFLLNSNTILIIIGVCFLSIIISSLYPAFFLSRLQPAETLKGGFISGIHLNLGIRKILVVVQFTISIALIAATIIIHAQLKYLNNGPLGFNKNNLVSLNTPWNTKQGKAFKNELLANPNIQFFTYSTVHIAGQYGATGSNDDPNDSTKQMYFAFIDGDFDFLKTFQIPLSSGRDFSPAYPSDLLDYDSLLQKQIQKNESGKTTNDVTDNPFLILAKQPIIITDDMVKALGLKNPVGHIIKMGACQGTIIGTIKEFNGISLKEKTPFIVIRCHQNHNAGQAYARINATNTQATISYISGKYKQFFPNEQFGFSFVDDDIAHLYDLELRLTKLFNIFTLFAIALSGMGLFSLVALMVHKRAKEIGIRKVMGATVNDVVVLISKDFLRLIIISFVIATPITYLVMYKWLQGYANRTEMSWWIFLVAGAIAILVAIVCIIYKTIVAAKANPVKSLSNE